MPYSKDYANQILNVSLAKQAQLSAPSTVYIGLSTNDPEADDGTFNELGGNGYGRVLICQRGETYPAVIGSASNRAIASNAQINWSKATLDWPRVKGFGLFSQATGGTPYYYGKLEMTEEEKAAGGVLCVAGAVMLIDPGTLRIAFTTTDAVAAAAE